MYCHVIKFIDINILKCTDVKYDKNKKIHQSSGGRIQMKFVLLFATDDGDRNSIFNQNITNNALDKYPKIWKYHVWVLWKKREFEIFFRCSLQKMFLGRFKLTRLMFWDGREEKQTAEESYQVIIRWPKITFCLKS